MNLKILLSSLLVLTLFLVVGHFYNRHVPCEKITSEDEVPDKILAKLSETRLERGVYLFTNNFTDSDVYVVICGGEQFQAGYNADVKKIFLNEWQDIEITFSESAATSNFTYCQDSNYPFVIFKIEDYAKLSEDFMMYSILARTTDTTEIPVINWWGNEQREWQEKLFSYQIIDNKENIDQVVWDKIKDYEFHDHPFIYVFSPASGRNMASFDIDDLYLIISPGQVENTNYRIAVENILFDRHNISGNIMFSIAYREYKDDNSSSFINSLGFPFEVVKISSPKFNSRKDQNISLKNGHRIFDTTSYSAIPIKYMRTVERDKSD